MYVEGLPLENNSNLRNINSIDEATEKLDHGLEETENKENFKIDPTEEFWAHCSV